LLEAAWAKVRVQKVEPVHYPVYVAIYNRPDGARRIEAIDGVTGLISELWSQRLYPPTLQDNPNDV
jgi:hypothetical protein